MVGIKILASAKNKSAMNNFIKRVSIAASMEDVTIIDEKYVDASVLNMPEDTGEFEE